MHALRVAPQWRGVLAFNGFALRTIAAKTTPWGFSGEWSEQQDALTAEWLHHAGIFVSLDVVARAIDTVANENSFHPIRAYLDGIRWDGIPRIDTWLPRYAGAEDTPYARATGSKWLISAVARIREPGCKADHVLIIEGPQALGKSTMIRTLGQEFYTDDIADLGSKDSAMQVQGAWIIELPELDSLARSEMSRIKAFITRASDRFRPPYGHRVIETPRQCVFAGTVNHSNYLRDETGGRRFWPVECRRIDIESLGRDRDQIWAESQYRYSTGESWWITDDVVIHNAVDEQAARYEGDPWEHLITEWAESREVVTIEQILMHCLEKPRAQWSQADKNRISRCLRCLGWERYQQRIGEAREWRYRRTIR